MWILYDIVQLCNKLYAYIKKRKLKMLITHLKTKLSLKTHTQTQIMVLPSSFIIGQFTIIFKLTELNVIR